MADASGSAPAAPPFDPAVVEQLGEFVGGSKNKRTRAAVATHGQGVEAAAAWMFSHEDDPALDADLEWEKKVPRRRTPTHAATLKSHFTSPHHCHFFLFYFFIFFRFGFVLFFLHSRPRRRRPWRAPPWTPARWISSSR